MTGLYGAEEEPATQRERLLAGEVPVAVYGLGKMGLPVAAVLADVTGNVIGADVDPEVVQSVERGDCHVENEPGLPELVAETVERGALRATSDPAVAASEAAVHIVVVPTLLQEDGTADLSVVESVCSDVAAGLTRGDLVCIESTVPPRTCADTVAPLIAEESGFDPGSFGVAFCPERTLSGRALEDIREAYPKVVGGVDPESTRAAALLYDEVTDNEVVAVSDSTTAEATKVFSGAYRDVNIALANEFARYAEPLGIDVREATAAANSQPHANILAPGPGVGGHCIPVYPHFLFDEFDVHSPLMRIARVINDSMPDLTVDLVCDGLAEAAVPVDEASVLLLGTTYRPGVAELRNTPAIRIGELLARRGATVYSCDPMVEGAGPVPAESLSLSEAAALRPDAVVVITPHKEFLELDWKGMESTVVVDPHDAIDLMGTDHDEYTVGRARALDATDAAPTDEVPETDPAAEERPQAGQ